MGSETIDEKHRGWVASLSNGETVFQTADIPGELSPWQRLLERCREEDIYITQIQMQRNKRTIVGVRQADGYCQFVDFRAEGLRNGQFVRTETLYGIGSVVGDKVYCTLINDEGQTWQDTRSLQSMRLHCQLKPADARVKRKVTHSPVGELADVARIAGEEA